jgi:hypothetical protein
MPTRVFRVAAALSVAAALALAATSGAVLAAAKKDGPQAVIETIKGDKYRMASAKMADKVTRFADALGDQVNTDGTDATEAPRWSDIKAVYTAGTKMPAKLRTKMISDYPPGSTGSLYGDAADDLRVKDRVVFVAVEMDKKLPGDAGGQQVEIGLSGNAATPVQVDSYGDTRAGVETFTLGGVFSNGAYVAGATDVSGRQPGDPVEYYNTTSGALGFYDAKRATWYIVVPRAGDTDAITVSVRSTTGVGNVIDQLELPGGGHFIDLRDPTAGFKSKPGLPALSCRSLETFSSVTAEEGLSDPEATLIRYSAGVAVDSSAAAELLQPAIAAMGPVDVVLTPVGVADAEPLTVTADLALAPAGNAISVTFEAPPGQWRFALAEGLELKTPAGEHIVDQRSLTGTAGVLTRHGLDGLAAGDLSCVVAGSGEAAADAADPDEAVTTAETDG